MSILFYAAPGWPPQLPWVETFTGEDGSQPNSTAWTTTGAYSSIQNNKWNFNSPGGNANYYGTLRSTFKLVGDLDIQLDFDISTLTQPPSGVAYAAILYVRRQSDNAVISAMTRGRGATGFNGYTSNGVNGYHEYSGADGSGKLRLTRISNVIRVFMWSGSQWEYNGNPAGRIIANSESGDLWVMLQFEQENNSTVNSNIDNFTINSADAMLDR